MSPSVSNRKEKNTRNAMWDTCGSNNDCPTLT